MNEMDTVRKSIRFRNKGQVRPLFWSAETRSRKTKHVKVCKIRISALDACRAVSEDAGVVVAWRGV